MNDIQVDIWAAITAGDLPTLQQFMEMGGNINMKRREQINNTFSLATPLHLAAQLNKQAIAGWLIDQNARVNSLNELRQTPLHLAASMGANGIVGLLLQVPHILVDAKDTSGKTPLMLAAQNGRIAAMEGLIDHHANLDAGSKQGRTPIYLAVSHNQLEAVEMLAGNGADLNIREYGTLMAPLHLAAKMQNINMCRLLLENGADINIENKRMWTPLHFAWANINLDLVELLIHHNADINKKNSDGKEAADLADDQFVVE